MGDSQLYPRHEYVAKRGVVGCAYNAGDGWLCGKPPSQHDDWPTMPQIEIRPATVTIAGLAEDATAITVGPDDVLVIRLTRELSMVDLRRHREVIEAALGRDRYVIINGDAQLARVSRAVVRAAEAGGERLVPMDEGKLVASVGMPCVVCERITMERCARCLQPACPYHDALAHAARRLRADESTPGPDRYRHVNLATGRIAVCTPADSVRAYTFDPDDLFGPKRDGGA